MAALAAGSGSAGISRNSSKFSTVKIVVTEKPVPEEPVENGENAA